MQDPAAVRAAFTDPREFWSSPLYRALSAVVADDDDLIALAAHARPGQVPTFAFFGAVHALLLDGVRHPLADHFASVRGDRALPPDGAGDQLRSFAREHADGLRAIVSTRLVQTNQVRRAVGLRLALATLEPALRGRRAHLLEIGSSAGLLVRQDRYGYVVGGRAYGDRDSPVQLHTEWRSDAPPPDLDAVPVLTSVTGIDLNPLDAADPADRRWLEALVWPEDRDKAALLQQALELAASHPVETLAGDAVDRCPEWAACIPPGDARIVFHCATRMHVPPERRPAFDAAIDAVGEDGPLYRVAIEGDGVRIAEPDGDPVRRFDVDGHLAWAAPVN